MARKNWNQWFFASTRGQIITLLRRSSRTVDELAQALNLTHTAVRAHLAALERDVAGVEHEPSHARHVEVGRLRDPLEVQLEAERHHDVAHALVVRHHHQRVPSLGQVAQRTRHSREQFDPVRLRKVTGLPEFSAKKTALPKGLS